MSIVKNLDIVGFFDHIQDPIVVFSDKNDLFFNEYFRENIFSQFVDWREIFHSDAINQDLLFFFKTGDLPKNGFCSSLILSNGIPQNYRWEFKCVYGKGDQRYCAAIGKPVELEKIENFENGEFNEVLDLNFVASVLRHSHDMVVILDKEGKYKFLSAAVIDKLGIDTSKIIGKSYKDFINEGIIRIEEGDLDQVYKSKSEININFWVHIPEGKKVYIESYCRNLIDDPNIRGILFSARDNTAFWKAKKSLLKRYELENLINRISAKFVNVGYNQVDQVFKLSLKMLGEFEKADRAYIFIVHDELQEIENVYEWTAENIEPQIQHLKNLPITDENLTIEYLRKGEVLVVPDVDLMPEKFQTEREIYQQQGIKSFVLIPIFSENKLIGFFGLDAVHEKRAWHEKDEYVLRQLGDIYAGSFINRAIKKRLERNEKLLASTEILAKSGSWRFSNTKRRIFYSSGLKRIFDLPEDIYSSDFQGFLNRIKKSDRRGFLEKLKQAVKTRSTTYGEFSIFTKEEKEKFISFTIQVREIQESSDVEVFGYCSDITHKKDAENYLKLQSQILTQVDDPIVVTDASLKIIYINKAGLKECKITEGENFQGKITDLFEFIFEDSNSLERLLGSLNSNVGITKQMQLRLRTGVVYPYEVSVQQFLNDDLEKIGYSFVIRNLSLQVRQEAIARKAQMIVENSPAVLFTVDPNENFRILYITENIRQFGYNSSKLVNSKTSILDLIHPDDVVRLLDYYYSRESETGIPAFSGEYRIRKGDGSYRWVEDRTREVYDSEGRIFVHEGILQDITERKNNREEILRSQERYRVLASNIPGTSIFLIDRDLRYIAAQGTNFADWGMTASDFEGKTLAEVHTGNLNEIQPIVTRALLKNEIIQKHMVFRRRVYEITVTPIMYGGEIEYALGILRDVNEEYQAKENLKKNEEKYRKLVEESTEIIFSLDLGMNLTYISPNVKQFLGYPSEDVVNKSLADFLHPEDLSVFSEKTESEPNFFEKNQYLEFRLRHITGDYRVFSSNGKLVTDEEGKKMYYTGIARDITNLKEAQKELFHAKEKAEQASTIKSQFLSIMSHEIRTPMNAVIGMAHLLIEDDPRPDQLENLKTLQFSAENLLGLINDILDYSKIDSGKVELEKVNFELSNVFNRILHSYSYQAREKALQIIFESDPTLPQYLIGDPVRLGQIVNNLVSNAVKFTEKGFIKIKLNKENEDERKIAIRFDFEDSGIGIPKEKLDLVFEAFTQASAATTRKYGGTGLGLAIVKRLVQLLGADIKAFQREEGGTRFTFTAIFEKPNSKAIFSQDDHPDRLQFLEDASILVAEDNLVNQIMIKKFLHKWGVKNVVMANDGNEAIEAYVKQDFNLILLDLQMPEKDGFHVAEFIRNMEDEKKKHVPIIALTASSLIEVKDQLDKVGMDDYISKPFNPDNLYTKILKYLKP
ncbi:PAS domain S-box protein [Aquiflexum sp. LQ15W]|uniref:PAS domain S-box protein n=1 Tax=Cognataquiflexum nitidum TaxID=2922272 RepID=UPI001F145C79|nr:PAS domain S-box protein [Cognataquiflexum nitidum]MCH6199183.1 PAS domain S-box protein [Cognataquiflexum nitidum]